MRFPQKISFSFVFRRQISSDNALHRAVSYVLHGGNLLVNGCDFFFGRVPMPPLAHGALFVPFGMAYVGFTIVYWAFGGLNEYGQPWVYKPIYWGDAKTALSGGIICALVLFVVAPLLVLACWAAVQVPLFFQNFLFLTARGTFFRRCATVWATRRRRTRAPSAAGGRMRTRRRRRRRASCRCRPSTRATTARRRRPREGAQHVASVCVAYLY